MPVHIVLAGSFRGQEVWRRMGELEADDALVGRRARSIAANTMIDLDVYMINKFCRVYEM
jgi:hypothetical protein